MNALLERFAAHGAREVARAHVAVLYGGTSSERDVSLITGREVARALAEAGDGRGPRRTSAVEIAADGRWIVGGRALAPSEALRALDGPDRLDAMFLALHGGDGEDGTIQGWLELSGVAFTGSGAQASAVCMDKLAMRGVAQQCGVAVAPGACFTRRAWLDPAERERGLARLRAASVENDGWIVKPRSGGSSVATFFVGDAQRLDQAVGAVLETGDDALIEARVRGVELSCGVLGNRGVDLVALPPVEIRPASSAFFDYREKYSSDGANELCPPQSVDSDSIARVQSAARLAHEIARCDGYSRTDFIVPERGEPVMLEVNTLPGLTPRSLLPKETAAIGIDYRTLCLMLVASALERWGRSA
jgi:D-alanine-D-alanine ligase